MGLLDALKKAKDNKAPLETPQQQAQPTSQQQPAQVSEQVRREQELALMNKKLDSIDDVPTLPTIVNKIVQSLNNPQSNAKEISDIIKNDPSITARILKVGNSAYYAGYSPCSTVQNAIARIGLIQMKRLIMSVSIFDSFGKMQKQNFNLRDFWTHSIAVAYAAKLIGQLSRFRDSDDLYTAGLLHDLGKLITVRYFPDMFDTIITKIGLGTCPSYYEAERADYPITHCEMGSWLAVKWNMSREIQAVIFNHHQPPIRSTIFDKDIIMFSAIVYLADKFCKRLEMGHSGDKEGNVDPEVFAFVFRDTLTQDKVFEEIGKLKPVVEATMSAI